MLEAVFDSTVLVSAFLTPKGVSSQLLSQAIGRAFVLYLSEEILQETRRVLLERDQLRKRYRYTAHDVAEFCRLLRAAFSPIINPPLLTGVSRDPNDDMVIACALAVGARYLITRDADLLTLGTYRDVKMTNPEEFMRLLREQAQTI